jgi:predicted GTPase
MVLAVGADFRLMGGKETINNTPCDLVIVATPIDLRRVVEIRYPTQRVRYELQEIGQPTLKDVLGAKFGLYHNSGNRVK